MRHPLVALVFLAASAALGAGCASTSLTVQRADANVAGVRYSLPKPFLLVKPSPTGDGTFTVEVIYLPNEDRTYAISGKTKRGKFSLDVTTEEGLLKKVGWNSTGTAESDTAIAKTAGDLAKSAIDKRAAEDKEGETKAEAERKALAADVKTARENAEAKTLNTKLAELELQAAQAAVANPEKPTAEERAAIRAAQLKLDKAREEQREAEERLRRRQAELLAAGGIGAANKPMGADTTKAKAMFFGPMLYEIRDNAGSVDLIPVMWPDAAKQLKPQVELETVFVKAPVEGAGSEVTLALTFVDAVRAGAAVTLRFDTPVAVKSVDVNQVNLVPAGGGVFPGVPTAQFDQNGKRIVLTYATLPAGDYSYVMRGKTSDDQSFNASGTVKVQ
jgi:hypothetical protein